MMKKLILIFLVLSSIHIASAQTGFPTPYSITIDNNDGYVYLPDSCFQIMADTTGKMTLQEVIDNGRFQVTDKKIDYKYDTYWLRYQMINRLNKEVDIYPGFNQEVDSVILYVKSDSVQWKQYKSGILVPWRERDGLKSIIAIHLSIPAGESITIYEKCTFNYIVSSPQNAMVYFNFGDGIDKLQREHYSQSLWSVFLLGMLLLALIINLYFFIIVREKEFLFFTLFLLLLGLSRIGGIHLATGFIGDVFFRDYPAMQMFLSFISGTFFYFLLIYFTRYALKTYHEYPRWDRYLKILSWVSIVFAICGDYGPVIVHKNLTTLIVFSFNGFTLITDIFLLTTILFYAKNKDIIIRVMVYVLVPYMTVSVIMDILAFPANISWLLTTPSKHSLAFMEVVWKLLDIGRVIGNICFVGMIILFACVLFMRFSRLRRRFAREKFEREQERRLLIEEQKSDLEKQVSQRTSELQQSLENLKTTQKQLIQSEKMASLGELTAGIAHEIQNPLNFVNNFSDINKELLEELRVKNYELKIEDPEIKELLNDIEQNSEKINHHGKRADAIVKGMLQHSRISTGKKEPTDINALCDEYFRLSYHGMRAKDKSFNCEMKTDFDKSIGKINIVPQDIGRVILNLINNAFYACAERSRSALNEKEKLSANSYQPIAEIKTRRLNDTIEITVADNGNGIPEKIKDKIFQPFFTTKPTGQGTGLGLSLSYDIVKAHGGEIKVESSQSLGTEFIVQLRIN